DGRLAQDGGALPPEQLVGPDGDGDQQVPRRAAVLAGVALAPDGDGLPVVDARRDAGLDGLFLPALAAAPAGVAGLVDDAALGAALSAGGRGGEDAHGRLPPDLDCAGAVAVRAHVPRGAGGAAVAVAGVAGLVPLHGDFLLT